LAGKPEGKRSFGSPKQTKGQYDKENLKTEWEGVVWFGINRIYLAQDRDQ